MEVPWSAEIEPEVRGWLESLSGRDYLRAEHVVERLLDAPTTLGEPYSRHLGGDLRELRFALGHDGQAVRVTYWLAPGRRVVLLTVFCKTRNRETLEVERAQTALKRCQAEGHHAHDLYSRDIKESELT